MFKSSEPVNYQTVEADPRYDTEEAQEAHEKALKIIEKYFSDEPCLFQHNHADLAKAEQYLQEALLADVTYGPAHNTLGTVYYWQRKYYLAAWEYEYAAKLMPAKAEPLFNLGLVYEDSEQIERASEYFSMALMLEEQDPKIMAALIRTEMKFGKEVDDLRPLLKKMIFYETRPEWVAWAKDKLGESPASIAKVSLEKLSEDEEKETSEESSLQPRLVPPVPGE